MSVIEKAKELGLAIVESKEYKRMQRAEEAQQSDSQAMELLKQYSDVRRALALEVQQKQPDAKRMEEIREQINSEYEKIRSNETIGEYLAARLEFQKLLQQVNSIISFYVNGDDSGCSSDCSSCSGCC